MNGWRQMGKWTDVQIDEWMDGDRWVNGWMDGWTDVQMDG